RGARTSRAPSRPIPHLRTLLRRVRAPMPPTDFTVAPRPRASVVDTVVVMDAAEGASDGARLAPEWTGRADSDGPEHATWHRPVQPAAHWLATGGGVQIGLLGFCSDEGVRRNGGRHGARQGPAALRRVFAPVALQGELAKQVTGLVDHG